jgi:hypothetical protein
LALLVFFRRKKSVKEKAAAIKEDIPVTPDMAQPVKQSPDILSMLSTAERYFMTGNLQSGWNQLYETLMSAVLFKTGLDREEASVNQIGYRLRMKNTGEENIAAIISFLDELNTLRYQTSDVERVKLSDKLEKTRNISLSLIN